MSTPRPLATAATIVAFMAYAASLAAQPQSNLPRFSNAPAGTGIVLLAPGKSRNIKRRQVRAQGDVVEESLTIDGLAVGYRRDPAFDARQWSDDDLVRAFARFAARTDALRQAGIAGPSEQVAHADNAAGSFGYTIMDSPVLRCLCSSQVVVPDTAGGRPAALILGLATAPAAAGGDGFEGETLGLLRRLLIAPDDGPGGGAAA